MNWDNYQKEFLLFSCFGITSELINENPDKATIICIDRAYHDLKRTIDYLYSDSEQKQLKQKVKSGEDKTTDLQILKTFNDLKNNWKKQITNDIFCWIKICIFGKCICENDFNLKHREICVSIIEKSKINPYGENLFKQGLFLNYGHVQKWINMTLKYMLLMNIYSIRKITEFLHIPIDNYILKELYEKDKNKSYNGYRIKLVDPSTQQYCIENTNDNINGAKKYKWSGIPTYNDYNSFRIGIEKCIGDKSPIAWEANAWLKQAKMNKGESYK